MPNRYLVARCLLLFVAIVLSSAPAHAGTRWEGKLEDRLDPQKDRLSDGALGINLRYRGDPGDVVRIALRGAYDAVEDSGYLPIENIALEFLAADGRWQLATKWSGGMRLETRTPASGVIEFRLRATSAAVEEFFTLEVSGETDGFRPRCFVASDAERSLSVGGGVTYKLDAVSERNSFEIQIWSRGFSPALQLENDQGHTLGFYSSSEEPLYAANGYDVPAGRYTLQITSRDQPKQGGDYRLRIWFPIPLERANN